MFRPLALKTAIWHCAQLHDSHTGAVRMEAEDLPRSCDPAAIYETSVTSNIDEGQAQRTTINSRVAQGLCSQCFSFFLSSFHFRSQPQHHHLHSLSSPASNHQDRRQIQQPRPSSPSSINRQQTSLRPTRLNQNATHFPPYPQQTQATATTPFTPSSSPPP